tara:strand:+ start:2206 stop:2580 length:375 start_codon:yes stop_codon:yes gene_type:complete
VLNIKKQLNKEVNKMTTQKVVQLKKTKTLSPIENVKLFKACELNDQRKLLNKTWVDVKEEALQIVDSFGGSMINKYKSKSYYIEIAKKGTTRFDVKSFKEQHPHLYKKYIVEGESIELKTKIVK